LRRSQRISKAPAQGRGEEGEDEYEYEEEEVLLTSTQQKALQSQTTPPIQQTQQSQTAQQTPPIQQTQQSQMAQQTQQSQTAQQTQQSQTAQQTQQSQTAQQTQQLSAQSHPFQQFQQFQQFQLQQSQQSQTTASSSQLSATSSSTPLIIDSDDREIIIRSRSRATTPGVDILAEFEDFGITRPESVDDRSPTRSRRNTPVIDANIEDIAPSSKPTGTKRRDSTRDTKSIEAMLVKQGKQIRALYELQKSTLEKVTSIQNQLKKTNKNIELSSKVFAVSNNLITDNNIIIILVSYHI
jgi:hypothetical protein